MSALITLLHIVKMMMALLIKLGSLEGLVLGSVPVGAWGSISSMFRCMSCSIRCFRLITSDSPFGVVNIEQGGDENDRYVLGTRESYHHAHWILLRASFKKNKTIWCVLHIESREEK